MARVTVEDCMRRVGNQFELAAVASKQARQLARGADATRDWENDKPTVMALREIAAGTVDAGVLNEPDLPPAMPSSDTPPQPPGPTPEELEADELATGKPLEDVENELNGGPASDESIDPAAENGTADKGSGQPHE